MMLTPDLTLQLSLDWAIDHRWVVGDQLRDHYSPSYAFWLVLEGVVEVWLGKACWAVPAGELLFTPIGCRRHVMAPQGARWLSVGFRVLAPGGIDLLRPYQTFSQWKPEDGLREQIRAWMAAIVQEKSSLIRDGFGRVLLGTWLREGAPALPAATPEPEWLARVMQAAQTDPGLSVQDAARLAGLSPAQFRHRFHAVTAMAPQTYLLTLRRETACRLLATTTLTVAEIAEQLGFAHPAHFTRFFTRVYGSTPTHYRDTAQWRAL